MLTPMRFKNYVWPHNPKVYSIDYARKMAAGKTPFGRYFLQDLGQTNRIMAGEGEFVGADAYAQFGKLANARIHGIYRGGSVLKQAIGKTTGRGPDIQGSLSANVDLKSL